jgi:hypothetical protein
MFCLFKDLLNCYYTFLFLFLKTIHLLRFDYCSISEVDKAIHFLNFFFVTFIDSHPCHLQSEQLGPFDFAGIDRNGMPGRRL